jgi:hypothetical protein
MTEATPTVVIDNKEYAIDALPESAQVNLGRVQQLRQEISELQMVLEERQLVLQARQNAVVRAVQDAEQPSAEEAEPEGT